MTLHDPPSGAMGRARRNLEILETLRDLGPNPGPLDTDTTDLLAQWSGWGPMAKAFDPTDETWRGIGENLAELLDEPAAETAFLACPTAFYTSERIMDAAWTVAEGLGFRGGNALEAGCGSGRFMAAAPDYPTTWTGVEFDVTSARIAQMLHPAARIVNKRLEQTTLSDGTFDLVIGNVPFANVSPSDRAMPHHRLSLHNYFLRRGLNALKPGGLLVAVTSRFTLDAEGNGQRQTLATNADLLGAIRLPSKAFSKFGTDVVTDIVVMRRRYDDDPEDRDLAWTGIGTKEVGRRRYVEMNRYFIEHPDQIIGDLGVARGQFSQQDLTVTIRDDFDAHLDRATGAVVTAGAGLRGPEVPKQTDDDPIEVHEDAEGRKEGSYHLVGQKEIAQVQFGKMVPVRWSTELAALIRIRDAVLAVLDAEADLDTPDEAIAFDRIILNQVYDDYVGNDSWGPLNRCTVYQRGTDKETGLPLFTRRRPNMGGFADDPDYVTVLAIEEYDDDSGVGTKGPIFERRVNRRPDTVESVDTIQEAIAVCLDRHGAIAPKVLADLLSIPFDAVLERLGEVAFEDPALLNTGGSAWVPADEYLSGNVREKLAFAKAAVHDDPARFHRNVSELTKVIPEDLAPEQIIVRPGAPWIPESDMEDFIVEVIADHQVPSWANLRVDHNPTTATWEIGVSSAMKQRAAATNTWGTQRIDAYKLLETACNQGTPEVWDKIGDSKVKNQDETLLAIEKMQDLIDRFTTWIWEDPDRTERLVRYYNDTYNSTVLRRYDGSHLTFPGMREGFTPYQSQLDMVYRALCLDAAGCGHVVGAGKTAIMAMIAAKMRQLGFVNKPMAVVPNHLLEQASREIKALFPMLRILMVTKRDMDKKRRKLFAAKVATGDWDLVVITHTAFSSLPMPREVEADYLREDLERWEQSLRDSKDDGSTNMSKQLAKAVEKRRAKLDELLNQKVDDGVHFAQLGVDYLLIDESHYFKNLDFPTRVQGLSIKGSKRAQNLQLKLWYIRTQMPGSKVATLFSGTLVSNTLAEMFVVQTYLQPERLRELQIDMFDAWAGLHVGFETKIEVSPDGKSFRQYRRPAKFSNVPELRRTFAEKVDVRTKGDLALNGPNVEHEAEVVDPTPELAAYVDFLVMRADGCRNRGGPPLSGAPENDNMLLICTDGRKAALDLDLVGVPTSSPGKVDRVVERVLDRYHQTKDLTFPEVGSDRPSPNLGALQILFCDLGTPNPEKGSQVYGKIRDALVAGGVPIEKIRFIHEAKTDAAKAQLFNECRNGHVAVLMGSTDKLGVGTNVQHRTVHLHHVDAPWRPSDVEQREGRGDRPGNQNDTLYVTRYVTEGSFDSYMWQTLERKAKFIAQVLNGDLAAREVPDIEDATLSYTEMKALATGNPLLLEAAEIQSELARLHRLQTAHLRGQRSIEQRVDHKRRRAHNLDAAGQQLAKLDGAIPDDAAYTAGRMPSTDDATFDAAEIGEQIGEQILAIRAACDNPGRKTGRVGRWGGRWVLTAEVQQRYLDFDCMLSIEPGPGQDPVELCEVRYSWLKGGQWFRLGAALIEAMTGLGDRADRLLLEATSLRETADLDAQEMGPFPQADELAAAEAKMADVEAAIEAAVSVAEGERLDAERQAAEAAAAE